jgi:hypothetical protein
MSKLFYTESGKTIHLVNEEVSARRRVRKVFQLPRKVASGGTLYVYAAPHPGCNVPLQVAVNGQPFKLDPGPTSYLHWFRLPVSAKALQGGKNAVELWCDRVAMDGWVLGLEGGHAKPTSWLSLDSGKSWQNHQMGLHQRMTGEYVLRLRLDDPALCDDPPAARVWEDRDCALFEEFRRLIPAPVQSIKDHWKRACRLSSWVFQQWTYRNTSTGVDYAPWDPLTILSWGKSARGHALANPVVMCVHYGVVFTAAALAVGIPSRNVCSTSELDRGSGHFISEVWMEKWGKWCAVDPTADLVYVKDGVPLSTAELYPNRDSFPSLLVRGTAFAKLTDDPRLRFDESLRNPEVYKYWSAWPRNDYLSHPELTPPSHGATAYVESDWLWQRPADGYDLGMFPHVLGLEALQEPPPKEWRGA